jgi:hypothetical protein
VTPLPKAMQKIAPDTYVRSEFWQTKMAAGMNEPVAAGVGTDDDDLPF